MAETTSVLGRPRSFDEDSALERSMLLFWQVGYDGASVRDLGAVMGVGQTSLYSAFGDKASLYLAAIKRFEITHGVLNMSRVEASTSLSAAITVLLEDAISRYTAPRRPLGCMILSGRVCDKPSQRKLLLKLRERRSRQGTAISHAMRGFSDITDPTFLSQYLLSHLIGLSTLACDGVPASILRKSVPLVTAGALAATR
ncbi:TetR/AcrR family transcriptional regulator [Brevundimonas sp. EYE_349]|uniref:TetR/AcrR family transcriptional regulator n=1 Tax=Brevundimonas sp. EYE_349 TaxID=2853455 RepID=UPI002004F416|nr:TetR/AcrR family transcriptional regulator [Brevundimonas sp. EYE_349]MCK6103963.1 TetR/AcrR family transcriptional regulator [Brevundimonas sp. EYE_349]